MIVSVFAVNVAKLIKNSIKVVIIKEKIRITI